MIATAIEFLLLGLLLIGIAVMLTRAADKIADNTGIGRVFIGTIVLAIATSLPELATDVAAVRMGARDLAAGDLFGSSMANMLIFALVGLFAAQPMLRQSSAKILWLVALAMFMNASAAGFVLVRPEHEMFGIAPESLLLTTLYVLASYALFRRSRPDAMAVTSLSPPTQSRLLRPAILRVALAALMLLLIAPQFSHSAVRLAKMSGLGLTFVGTLLVGLSTSLPELVVSITAWRMGSPGLAIGNLFGSNAFNMVVFLAMDIADPHAPIFANLDPAHAFSALLAIILMGLAGATVRAASVKAAAGWRWTMLVAYVLGIALMYFHSAGLLLSEAG